MKKLLFILIACIALLCLLCSCSSLDLAYVETREGYTITGRGESTETDIVIPETIKKKPVTSIDDGAFYYNLMADFMSGKETPAIISISLPSTITYIGSEAFANNEKLETVNIPENVTEIGEAAFYRCLSLQSITIPEGITVIKKSTFAGCSSLTSITIPDSVKKIEAGAFEGCSSLKTVTLSSKVTTITEDCFKGCSSLETAPITENVTTIEDGAFEGCTSLKNFTIPDSVTKLGYGVFFETSSTLEISVSYDSTAPEGWNENWHAGMNGKALNTSEVYYANVVVPAQEKAAELQQKIDDCLTTYQSLKEREDQIAQARRNAEIAGNYDAYKDYNKQFQACREQQSQVMKQRDAYKEELATLPTTNQLNKTAE